MRRWLWLAFGAAAFVVYNVTNWWTAPGDDWSSIWVGASMVRHGRTDLLYSINPDRFTDVGDPAAWMRYALLAGRPTLGHPYVHEPGLAYLLSPLAGSGSWLPSLHVLLVLDVLAVLGTVWVVGRMWAPVLLRPVPFAVTLLALTLSEPLRYGLWLGQTTPIILLLTVAGIALARRHPFLAGLLLALPVSIKITPVLVAVWWLVDPRRRKALLGLVTGLAALAGVQLAVAGPRVVGAYWDALHHVQQTTTTGFSNQSVAGWLVDFLVHQPVATYPTRTIPGWVSALCTAALVVSVVLVVLRALHLRRHGVDAEPFATAGLLVAGLPFTPLSWTHYYLVLLVPAAVLITAARRSGRSWPYLVVAAFVALDMQPLAVNGPVNVGPPDSILRSHLLAGVIALVALLLLSPRMWRAPAGDVPSAQTRAPAAPRPPAAGAHRVADDDPDREPATTRIPERAGRGAPPRPGG